MKVYLSAPWIDKGQMPAIAERFVEAGHSITERWWEIDADIPDYPSNADNAVLEYIAMADFHGALSADVLVVLNTSKSEGKAVETGIAMAMGTKVILVGTRSNIFHYMPDVVIVDSIEDALEQLQ